MERAGKNRRNQMEGESRGTSREPENKTLFLLFMTTGSVMRMQQALGQRTAHIAQVTLVALTHHDIVLRLVQVEHLARGIKPLGAELLVVVGVIVRLPPAVYATMGACHDFNKVVAAFADGYSVEQHFRIF